LCISDLSKAMNSLSQPQTDSFERFARDAERGNVVAIAKTFNGQACHPVDAFVQVAGDARYAFLFESVEGGQTVANYSFVGANPHMIVRGRAEQITIERNGVIETREECLPDFLRHHFSDNRLAGNLPPGPLAGGAVGYFGYGAAKWFEPALKRLAPYDSESPIDDAVLMFYRTVVVFDHVEQKTTIVSVVFTDECNGDELRQRYDDALREIVEVERRLNALAMQRPDITVDSEPHDVTVHSNLSAKDFHAAVASVKEHIFAGDCYQTVISQRFSRPVTVGAVPIYRALRLTNPAPYTYLLKINDQTIIGASPEMLLRARGRELAYRPIAGTRRRGVTGSEDQQLAEEMCADGKEVAEHMMLVDLGRNDLGRVAEFGSVQVEDLMSVERYSKVQHLVSSLRARLREGKDRFDALASCFPAGTVSGAPKVRAMEIIRELEPDERGVYAGAILYIDYADNLDSCIAIRTIVLDGNQASVQAGAGIVADSLPEREFEETVHKAGALLRAIEIAENETQN
jgi:anthranilate synthase component 1